jgi:hypothetical protein
MIEFFASKSVNTFIKQLRSIIHNYWRGNIDIAAFEGEFNEIVQKQLRLAFQNVSRQYGVTPKFYTKEEKEFIDEQIAKQQSFIPNFANQIKTAKKDGGKVQPFFNRVEMWATRWNEIESRAHLMFGENEMLEWKRGPTSDSCADCRKFDGQRKRKSTWKKMGYWPKSENLECNGYG